MTKRTSPFASRFLRDETGAQFVEFGMVLPLMLLFFAVTIEGARMMWSYQTVIAGVRDATRYVARIAPREICSTGPAISTYDSDLDFMIRTARTDDPDVGTELFPSGIEVLWVSSALDCSATGFRADVAPIVEVTAALQITFPFSGIFRFWGGDRPTINTVVSDQHRVYGS